MNFKLTENVNLECALFESQAPDTVVWSINNSMIFRAPILDLGLRIYNIHNGVLPAYRGLPEVAIIFAILHGEVEYGATLHQVDAGIDTGRILAMNKFPIGNEDTFETVMVRGVRNCEQLFTSHLAEVVGRKAQPIHVPQVEESYYGQKRLRTLHEYSAHPAFSRATKLGVFADVFPPLAGQIAKIRESDPTR